MAHLHHQRQKRGELRLQFLVVTDLAIDIADHAAEPEAQEFQFGVGTLELMGMDVTPGHDGGAFGHPHIGLP